MAWLQRHNVHYTDLVFGKMNADYYVGDRVTFADDDLDLYSNVRILSATEVQDENGYSIDVEFGG